MFAVSHRSPRGAGKKLALWETVVAFEPFATAIYATGPPPTRSRCELAAVDDDFTRRLAARDRL